MADRKPLCPSAPCESGALLLGVVDADGQVVYNQAERRVDDAFVAQARQGRSAEKRFPFANTCRCKGCSQWAEGRCTVVSRVLEAAPQFENLPASPRTCAIRPDCRWFQQVGMAACAVCSYIQTDNGRD